jgi:SAM-dependent methyltransferase
MMEATAVGLDKRVLDIGCGYGYSSALMSKAGASVVGVDAAVGMIDYAKRTFSGVDFQVGGLEDLSFADNEFDVVFAANSVQYAADLNTALQELMRVCKPGGLVAAGLFGPPASLSYASVLGAVGQFMPAPPQGSKPGGPFRLSAPGVLEDAFVSVGLDVVNTGTVNCPFVYESWDEFWRVAKAAGPFQMVIDLAGLEAVEQATRTAVESHTAQDGSVSFDPNAFIFVVGRV